MSTDKAAEILSNCLLKGMVMTAQVCPDCSSPLMRNRKSKEVSCPVCEQIKEIEEPVKKEGFDNNKDENNDLDLESKRMKIEAKEDIFQTSVSNPIEENSNISNLLGKKLLQGWTLLDTLCPNLECKGVPLMRNKQKISMCVNCGREFILEADYDSNVHGDKKHYINPESVNTKETSINSLNIQENLNSNLAQKEDPLSIKKIKPCSANEKTQTGDEDLISTLSICEDIIKNKLLQLSEEVQKSNDPKSIKDLSEAIVSLHSVIKSSLELDSFLKV